jgi:hypothetical protein
MGRKRQYSNDFLLDQVEACAQRLGESPTQEQFDADPETTVASITVRKRFHGWNEALAERGLAPTRHGRRPMGPQAIIERIKSCHAELGYVPTGIEFCRATGLSMGTIYREFGTWNRAVAEAGITLSERAFNQRYSDLDLLSQLASWISAHGREPTFAQFSADPETVSAYAMTQRFGSWTQAKELARDLAAQNADVFAAEAA